MNKVEQLLKTNKKTYLYSKMIKIRKNTVKSIIQLVGAIISYPSGKKKTLVEYNQCKRGGYIYKPCNKSVHSKFYLPLLKLEEDMESDAIQYSIFMLDNYFEFDELEIVKSKNYIDEKTVVLDIGSNIGNHSLFFCNECNCKKVYAFEPVPETYNMLKKNIEINQLEERVIAYNNGVGATASKASIIHFDWHNIGGTTLEASKDGDISIISIDSLNITDKIGFVKIDTEGFEVEVVKGMMKITERDKPIFWIETSGDKLETIKEMLQPLGYKNVCYLGDGDYIFGV